jgi:UDP-N-acetylmuramoyl-L-alanyl-D-glutamate--2,6-diaminopimelate ligase
MSMPAEHLTTTITLAELFRGFADAPAIRIQGISSDSRQLKPGDLFLACAGHSSHGLDYVGDAVSAGVAAIAWDSSTADFPAGDVGVPMVAVEGLAQDIGEIANRYYGRPSDAVRVIGVTGTNGKTTVAWLVAQCMEALGRHCGYVGTLGIGIGEIDCGDGMTTPGVIELHQNLANFRDQGAEWAAVEVSSHALSQDRIAGVALDTVMFTNLSRDHLDYHGDMQSYAETKARLFLGGNARHRIINLDSEFGAQLASRCGQDVVTVSSNVDRATNGRPYVFVRSVVATEGGSLVKVSSSWGDGEFSLSLPGDFNVANAVTVLALLLRHGVPTDQACDALSTVDAPPGRMQRVTGPDTAPSVFVDYAHTPAAIEVALRALRAHCKGQLWCVMGCGGDRDVGKRPQMGRAAERVADRVVITSDNPRSESPTEIIDGIVGGAIDAAAAEDCILVAGKGHENYQLVGDERRDFSDVGVAATALAALQKVGV